MKLLRLKIQSGFRSLPKGFEMYFLRDFDYGEATDFNPYILAGMNGSGKSNVLEALAEIFYHLVCIYLKNKPEYFDKSPTNENGFDPKISQVNAYELEYFTFLDTTIFPDAKEHRAHIKISKVFKDRPQIEWLNESDYRKPKELSQIEAKSLLPEYVIGYASGNNETLSIPFLKSRILQYDEYLSDLEAQEFTDPRPESSLTYLDERYSQAIVLTNLLMWREDEREILKPFEEYVGLEDVASFRLIIRLDKQVLVNLTDQEQDEQVLLLQNVDPKEIGKGPFVRSYLEKLRRCATVNFEKEEEWEEDFLDEDRVRRNYLYLDYKVNEATKQAFQFHFDQDPLKLFEVFQLLLSLELCELSAKEKQTIYHSSNLFLVEDADNSLPEEERILRFKDFWVKKKQLKDTLFTRSLSDGEHQFLHSLGLCLLFRNTQSLFLLDEPETHFNPDWKAKFISSIRNCLPSQNQEGRPIMREMLITTHSPFLISDSRMEYVMFFKKNEKTGLIESVRRPDFQTFGSSVNKIAIRIFSMPNTIGEYAAARLEEFKGELKEKNTVEELEDLIRRTQNTLGESVERTLFINQIFEKIKELG